MRVNIILNLRIFLTIFHKTLLEGFDCFLTSPLFHNTEVLQRNGSNAISLSSKSDDMTTVIEKLGGICMCKNMQCREESHRRRFFPTIMQEKRHLWCADAEKRLNSGVRSLRVKFPNFLSRQQVRDREMAKRARGPKGFCFYTLVANLRVTRAEWNCLHCLFTFGRRGSAAKNGPSRCKQTNSSFAFRTFYSNRLLMALVFCEIGNRFQN